jgi:hypothetical protein
LISDQATAIRSPKIRHRRDHPTPGCDAVDVRRPLRIALAIGGSLAVEGSPVQWVANHHRH